MNQSWDVIVLGTGGVGSAAMHHLASRGLKVLGLDRHEPGHGLGSSHGESRIIRKAYFEHPDYVPLLQRSYELWDRLQADAGRNNLFIRTGLLQMGPPDGVVISGVMGSAAQHGLELERMEPREVPRWFPPYSLPEDCVAVFERDAGLLRVEECVLAHVKQARTLGAELRTGVSVEGWRATAHGVNVMTNGGDFSAAALVVTAGAWAPTLLKELGIPMRVLRKPLFWLESRSSLHRMDQGCPCFFYELPEGQFYGFPELEAGGGVKMARHTGGDQVQDPASVDRNLDEEDFARVRSFASRCLPEVTGQLLRHATCMYTMSPDEHFIVDRHPEHPNVCFAAGLSGHGFKFASVLGEILADFTVMGHTPLPAQFLGTKRFGVG